jgi:hypothetical protein
MIIKSLHKSSYSFSHGITSSLLSLVLVHLVSALGPGASLLALQAALLGDALLVENVAGLLHELADGGVLLAVLVVGVVAVVGTVGTVGGVAAVGVAAVGAANAGAGGGAGGVAAGGGRLIFC